MSVTTQIIFPYMSDARTPAMDVQMTAQDVGMLRSFSVSLSAMLIVDDGYWASYCLAPLLLRLPPLRLPPLRFFAAGCPSSAASRSDALVDGAAEVERW